MKRPSFQFYPSDWRNDAGLTLCSLEARGLWIEMICIMHAAEPYGHLCAAGRPLNARDLARLVGESERDVKRMLEELTRNNVCSVQDGAFVSRRMVRDEALRDARAAGGKAGSEFGYLGAEHGKKGGRPRKETGDKKPPLEPPPSSSSSSSVIEEAKASLSASAKPTDDETDDGVPPCPFDKLIDSYKKHLPELPDVRRSLFAGGKNGKAMRSRWRWVLTAKHERGPRIGERLAESAQDGVAWFDRYFAYVADSDFLTGKSGAFTGCDLGWLVNAANFEKVLSGKYHAEKREAANA